MKLKEEWADSFKTKWGGGVIEAFVNPSKKEINDLLRSFGGIRWTADSETKKFYITNARSLHGDLISNTILKNVGTTKDYTPHFRSDRWLTGVFAGKRHGSDLFDADYWWSTGYGKKAMKKDWSWAYGYLPGLKEFIEKHKKKNLKEDIMKIDNLLDTMLTESGIRIPKGTHAAKVIFHRDMDGVMSAILTVNQLVKQGIPKNRIKLSSIQYGDNKEEVEKKLAASKGQMVALVDFARIPKEGVRKPDFWSDHHVQDDPKDKPKPKPKAKEKTIKIGKKKSDIGLKSSVSKPPKQEKDTSPKKKTYADEYRTKAKKDYPKSGVKKGDPIIVDPKTGKKYKEISYTSVQKRGIRTKEPGRPFQSIPTGKKIFTKQKVEITEAIGKIEYPSEAEHLAKVHAQNLMTGKDIKTISDIDSATYSNLKDVIDLPKKFTGKKRMERLAILTNLLLGKMLSSNPTAINELIMTANPSLVSVYNTASKLAKLNDKQARAIKELSKPNPNYALVSKVKSELSPEMAKDVKKARPSTGRQKSSGIEKLQSLEQTRKQRQKEIKVQTDPKTTQFKKGNEYVIIQTQVKGRKQPQRFTGSLLTKQSGERYPAMMREWATMFQISMNPSLKMEDKDKVNLAKGVDKILGDIIKDVNSGKIKVRDKGMTNWALKKVIRPEAGGHAGIATVGGLGTLGLAPKTIREELKKLYAYEERVRKLKGKKEMKDIMPKAAAKMEELKKAKEEFAQERTMLIAEIKKRILDGVAEAIEKRGVQPIKGSERFKVKTRKNPSIKESIQYRNRNWRT
jgi:hypothetical protein